MRTAGRDDELRRLVEGVPLATVLEEWGWALDARESTRRSPKWRRGAGEVVVLNHDGRGWWEAGGPAKGGVVELVQWLDRGASLGRVRVHLRRLLGVAPAYPVAPGREDRRRHRAGAGGGEGGDGPPPPPAAEQWAEARPIRPGSPGWRYLARERAVPAAVLALAAGADAVRERPGPPERPWAGEVWFAHRKIGDDPAGTTAPPPRDAPVVGFERRSIRGRWHGFCRGGAKALFLYAVPLAPHEAGAGRDEVAVCESAIEALSLAALDGFAHATPGGRRRTAYAGTTGSFGPDGEAEIALAMRGLGPPRTADTAPLPLRIATNPDGPGERLAGRLERLAEAAHGCGPRGGEAHGGAGWRREAVPGGHRDLNAALQLGARLPPPPHPRGPPPPVTPPSAAVTGAATASIAHEPSRGAAP